MWCNGTIKHWGSVVKRKMNELIMRLLTSFFFRGPQTVKWSGVAGNVADWRRKSENKRDLLKDSVRLLWLFMFYFVCVYTQHTTDTKKHLELWKVFSVQHIAQKFTYEKKLIMVSSLVTLEGSAHLCRDYIWCIILALLFF